ncbi:MAG: hypothetical protein ABIV06_07140 [Thermoanaerobaculia bacterium]
MSKILRTRRYSLQIVRTVALPLVLALASAPAGAQAAIGLSSVGAQGFGNEDLFFYAPEVGDRFGWSFATGDFNGDGAEDLATGMPWDNGLVGSGQTDCGIVIVRFGVVGHGLAGGLATTVLSQFNSGSLNPAESDDLFGYALATGDFNNDGFDDLAVGIPGDQVSIGGGEFRSGGAVDIHYGLPGGIQTTAEHHLPLYSDGSRFGEALATGDFNGDGHDDLAIGAPGYYSLFENDFWWRAGAVWVYRGHLGGLVPLDSLYISQAADGIDDWPQLDEEFGHAVAAGDFNGDGYDDLAIGVSEEETTGAVQVIMGSAASLDFFSNAIWLQDDLTTSPNETGDHFGAVLAVGDFDGDGYDDLAVSAPGEDLGAGGASADAGEVTVIYGTGLGTWFNLSRTDELRQGTIFGDPAFDTAGDTFGRALASGDFDGDGRDDLVIGQPGEDVGGLNRGGFTVLMGAQATGLYDRFRFLAAGISGVPPGAQDHSDMGRALAAGDFDGNGFDDLAVGIPFRRVDEVEDVGYVSVLYGALFADGFAGNSTGYWSLTEP